MIIMKKLLVFMVVLFLGIFITLDITTQAFALPPQMQERVDASGSEEPISSTKLSIKYYLPDQITALSSQIMGAKTSDTEEVITGGALPALGSTIAFITTTPPIQTGTYVADILQNTGLAQPAYAQGIGFSALTPILQIWKAFRNIAYFFIIIFFIIAGFMIMFRKQIDHSTVVTLQMALPKIITTLILITFSYAIAGFIIDMIYLTIFVFTEVLQAFDILESASTARNVLFGNNVVRVGWQYLMGPGEVSGGASQSVSNLITNALNTQFLDGITDALMYLVISIAILIAVFRTLFALVGAYVGIIISVIFAPIQLLFNALPGSNTFNSWIKSLIANAAVFPAVAIMILVGSSLVGVSNTSNDNLGINIQEGVGWGDGKGWVPPLIGSNSSTGVNAVSGVIGLGIIMLLPEVAKMIKEMLEVKDATGEMALANFQAGAKPFTAPTGMIGSALISGAGQRIGQNFAVGAFENKADRALKKELRKAKGEATAAKVKRVIAPQRSQKVGSSGRRIRG